MAFFYISLAPIPLHRMVKLSVPSELSMILFTLSYLIHPPPPYWAEALRMATFF
jgi:hypothetical protein